MILHRDHECFGMKRAVVTFDENAIGELQRTVEHKQDFVRRAKLDDGLLEENILAFAFLFADGWIAISIAILAVDFAVAVALGAAEPDRNPHRSGFGKEPRQPAYDVLFESTSSCLVGHGRPRSPELEQPSLLSSLFGRTADRKSVV